MGIDGRICQRNNCHLCCIETEMLLTKKDIHRIIKKTSIPAEKFVTINEDGYRVLKNHQKDNEVQCYFLDHNGFCSIYEIRPKGCKFYPYIWDLTEHKITTDDFCPHQSEFRKISSGFSKELEDFVFQLFGKL